MERNGYSLRLMEVGGGANIRDIWPDYFPHCHCIVYLIDGTDEDTFNQSLELLKSTMNHRWIIGKFALMFVSSPFFLVDLLYTTVV